MIPKTVWITGAGGLIGNYLVQTAARFAPDRKPVAFTRSDLDITDFLAVKERFRRSAPEAIIHCAAMSRSPDCQAQPALARKTNVDGTRNLAKLAAEIPFVFFSTDLVFDGRTGRYAELAAVNPLSVYAETKVQAEQAVLANPLHTVVRTSLNSGRSPTGDRGLDEQVRKAWEAGKTVRLFTDEFRSPIAAEVTARAVWELLNYGARGLYHVAGAERLSRWQIGERLAARWPEVRAKMQPCSLAEWEGEPRPPDTTLNCAKAQALLSFPLPRWTEWLAANPDTHC
jgi:dTDP-4-dehydrorhamnose reductase